MRVVKPYEITPAVLYSTSVTEAYAEYNAATSYALNARCIMAATGRIYECIQGPSVGNSPDTSPLWFMDYGPMNKQAMFDTLISTQTTATSSMSIVLKPGLANSIGLFNLVGSQLVVTVHDGVPGVGPLVYTSTIALDGTVISDWYKYFFEPSVQRKEVVLTDLPPYSNAHVTLTITGPSTVACGYCTVGTFYELGDVQYGLSAGIVDYSKKLTSSTGVTSFSKGKFSNKISPKVLLPNSQLNSVYTTLLELRATPCAWQLTDDPMYSSMNPFGFYRDFSVDVAYFDTSYCSIELESLT